MIAANMRQRSQTAGETHVVMEAVLLSEQAPNRGLGAWLVDCCENSEGRRRKPLRPQVLTSGMDSVRFNSRSKQTAQSDHCSDRCPRPSRFRTRADGSAWP